ncbi:Uncharacterized protein TCM_005264 [Theobroma cacao]|uniref:Uncharacterized protein n=1 Tax=Theobroma cacao TaxID=3641 RepID=A0A061DUV8_THECC|nr:Uncharacterized protein TCM_005264 [Theobroma cacao]
MKSGMRLMVSLNMSMNSLPLSDVLLTSFKELLPSKKELDQISAFLYDRVYGLGSQKGLAFICPNDGGRRNEGLKLNDE